MTDTVRQIKDFGFIIALSAVAVFFTGSLVLLSVGFSLIMLVAGLKQVCDEESPSYVLLDVIGATAFTALSGSTVGTLSFVGCRIKAPLRIALPPVLAVIYGTLTGDTFAKALLSALIILLVAVLLLVADKLADGYFSAKAEAERAIKMSAVGELAEKRLNRELKMKNYLADKNARLEERETISRNIHNSVGHSITAAVMTLDAADMLFEVSPDSARQKMNTANDRIRGSLDEIRHAVRVLDSKGGNALVGDLLKQVEVVCENFLLCTKVKILYDFPKEETHTLPIFREHLEFLVGAVSELLTNGVKHGNADRYMLRVTADSAHIMLSVSDNGKSDFSQENREERIKNGFGLKKLISYAERCAGEVKIDAENGFSVSVTLPIVGDEND